MNRFGHVGTRQWRTIARMVAICGVLAVLAAGCGNRVEFPALGFPSAGQSDGSASPSTPQPADVPKAVRVASGNLITKPGSKEPKVVLGLYEDLLCPVCERFEEIFGPAISQLIDSGSVATDYYMVSILDSARTKNYSSRAGAAAYCVADEGIDVFRRFHAALYAKQPSEVASTFPTNQDLIEVARQAGATGGVPKCVDDGRYVDMVEGLAAATNTQATPTVRINGDDYDYSTPEALVAKIKQITG